MDHKEREVTVSVRNLRKQFDHFTAVDRVSFDVHRGEIFGFLGPNGAGKSTTIRMLCGILPATDGEGTVAGLDIRRQSEQVKAHIGYMSQKFSLYEDLTVEENINFFSGIYRIPRGLRSRRREWVLEMAGLKQHRDSLTGVLSAGWKQRLALGCALMHEPSILFLDEPTSGVDPISRRRFWDLIHQLAGRGVTVFVTTHYMDEAEYCDRLGLIYDGKLIALGTPEELKRRHMKETVLEVACERPMEAMTHIKSADSVKEIFLSGNHLHAVVWDAERAAAAIQSRLEQGSFSPVHVEPVAPALEDVFVSMIEAQASRKAEAKA